MENVLLGTLIPTEGRVLFPQKILSALVILNMEKTMVAEVISELKSISRLKIFWETEANNRRLQTTVVMNWWTVLKDHIFMSEWPSLSYISHNWSCQACH